MKNKKKYVEGLPEPSSDYNPSRNFKQSYVDWAWERTLQRDIKIRKVNQGICENVAVFTP